MEEVRDGLEERKGAKPRHCRKWRRKRTRMWKRRKEEKEEERPEKKN